MIMVDAAVPPELRAAVGGLATAVRLVAGHGGAGMLTQATIETVPEKPLRLEIILLLSSITTPKGCNRWQGGCPASRISFYCKQPNQPRKIFASIISD
jgi:hypothetical protein